MIYKWVLPNFHETDHYNLVETLLDNGKRKNISQTCKILMQHLTKKITGSSLNQVAYLRYIYENHTWPGRIYCSNIRMG